jgi:hypothetical protein
MTTENALNNLRLTDTAIDDKTRVIDDLRWRLRMERRALKNLQAQRQDEANAIVASLLADGTVAPAAPVERKVLSVLDLRRMTKLEACKAIIDPANRVHLMTAKSMIEATGFYDRAPLPIPFNRPAIAE